MNRIKKLRIENKISQLKLAKILNVHQTAISQWETGRTTPDIEIAKQMAAYFNVTLDYLLENTSTNVQSKRKTGIKIPVFGSVAAGIPIEAITDIEDYEEITEETAAKGDYFALRIKGTSMEPDIKEGSVVIVRQQSYIDDGRVAIVLINGDEATCKRVQKTPDGILLMSNNPSFQPMFFTNQQIEDLPIRIIGQVEECRTKIF